MLSKLIVSFNKVIINQGSYSHGACPVGMRVVVACEFRMALHPFFHAVGAAHRFIQVEKGDMFPRRDTLLQADEPGKSLRCMVFAENERTAVGHADHQDGDAW